MIDELAKVYLDNGFYSQEVKEILRKKTISKPDYKELLKYCKECQKQQLDVKGSQLTIKNMRKTIFTLIGRLDKVKHYSSYQGGTFNKEDLLVVYQFITNLPAEYLKDKNDEQLS